MDFNTFNKIIRKYKVCPKCGASYKGHDLGFDLQNEKVSITCTCGFKAVETKDSIKTGINR